MEKLCPKGHKMTLLLTSYVCDTCEENFKAAIKRAADKAISIAHDTCEELDKSRVVAYLGDTPLYGVTREELTYSCGSSGQVLTKARTTGDVVWVDPARDLVDFALEDMTDQERERLLDIWATVLGGVKS